MLRLSTTERNLLSYLEAHHNRTPTAPCFIPKNFSSGTMERYLAIIERMEHRGLLRVKRNDGPYFTWTLKKISSDPFQ